jgi:FixJ family two-component response regulator
MPLEVPIVVNPMTRMPTVVVVDDDEMIRNSLECMLCSIELAVLTFAGPHEILDRPLPDDPGCLILDMNLPEMSGLDLRRQLVARGCNRPFILMSGTADLQIAVRALREGALDVLEKPLRRQHVIECVRQAVAHDARARRMQAEQDPIQARFAKLTVREKEVFRKIQQGKITKQISRELLISPKTVDVHRSNILRKMQVDSMAGLLHMMYRFASSEHLAEPCGSRGV